MLLKIKFTLKIYISDKKLHAEAVSRKGAPLDNCFGFIDGTFRPISRPGTGQRVVYNGHESTRTEISVCYVAQWIN